MPVYKITLHITKVVQIKGSTTWTWCLVRDTVDDSNLDWCIYRITWCKQIYIRDLMSSLQWRFKYWVIGYEILLTGKYIYIYMCVCVCVCVCLLEEPVILGVYGKLRKANVSSVMSVCLSVCRSFCCSVHIVQLGFYLITFKEAIYLRVRRKSVDHT